MIDLFSENGQLPLYYADVRDLEGLPSSASCVTSPSDNAGIDYDDRDDPHGPRRIPGRLSGPADPLWFPKPYPPSGRSGQVVLSGQGGRPGRGDGPLVAGRRVGWHRWPGKGHGSWVG